MARILVIDDDLQLLKMVRLMLERVGHEVETVSTGKRGIAMAAENQPDLAIIDVMMPELNGYDVVKQLRADPQTKDVPIMILTARSQPVDKKMALDAGANSFMSKPVTAQELTARVDEILEAGVKFQVHTGRLEPIEPDVEPDGSTQPVEPPPTVAAPESSAPAAAEEPGGPPVSRSGRRPIGADDLDRAADIPPARLPVLTMISLRGGTGCTTVALNLAALLARAGRRICITDLSTAGGHVQLHLHLNAPQNWGHLLPMGDMPDPRAINDIVMQHQDTQICVLTAPPLPSPNTLSEVATQNILRELTSSSQLIMVDAGVLNASTVGALKVSGLVVVVMADDPPAVHTTGQTLLALQNLGIDPNRLRVVLNHTRPQAEVPTATIQKMLKRPLTAELPYDPNHSNAIRRGVPLVRALPDSGYAQAIQQMAQALSL